MTQTPENQKQPEPEDKSIKVLRSIVINMGILLVVGTLALFVAIIIKANSKSEPKKTEQVKKVSKEEGACEKSKAGDINILGEVISAKNDSGIITVTTSKQVYIYDVCSGQILAKFNSMGN